MGIMLEINISTEKRNIRKGATGGKADIQSARPQERKGVSEGAKSDPPHKTINNKHCSHGIGPVLGERMCSSAVFERTRKEGAARLYVVNRHFSKVERVKRASSVE